MAVIDVVIPTYNHAPMLREALRSLVAQTEPRWHAYVINNNSTDDTVQVIDSFADSRITRTDFANHGVIGAARNTGIIAGSAEFVAFLDSDDVWYPDKLAQVLAAFTTGVDLVCHAERWLETDGTSRVVEYGSRGRDHYDGLLFGGNALSTSAVTMRRTLLERVRGFDTDPQIVTAEDYDLWLRASREGGRFVFLPQPLGEFRRRQGSESSRISRNAEAERAVLRKHFSGDGSPRERVRRRRRFALVDYGAARSYQRDGALKASWSSLIRCILMYPLLLRPYAALVLLLRDTILRRGAHV